MVANTTPKVHMGTLTGDEGRAIYAQNPVILLPMGSHEDQGPHAPMGDYLLAEKMAELAALRATEINAELLLKATKVDGIYDSDPKKNPDAKRFERLTYDEVLNRKLQVMDTAAFALCRENDIPLRIYDMGNAGALMRILQGEDIGTLVTR